MRIEITGVSLVNGVVTISAADVSEENLQRMERTRSEELRELEYQFDTKHKPALDYLNRYMHRQKAAKGSKTWGDALRAIIGTVTESPLKIYRVTA